MKNISDEIVEILTRAGVKHIFGIPGDTIDSLMESLRIQKEIEFIIMRHEEAGAFAASAQAKLTGKLAVCVACQGPGAVHLLNGLYDAKLDRAPVLAITGQVDSALIGTGSVQEVNQISLFEDVAVYNQEVRSAENLHAVLARACEAAIKNRGVAHISIPSDIMRMKASDTKSRLATGQTEYAIIPEEKQLAQAVDMINKANKVAILYGDGARFASDELLAFAEKIQAPLVHTTRSKDIIRNDHPYYVGGIGLMGCRSGNYTIQHCDLLLVVGSSFAFREYYPESAPIIQIELDPTRIGQRIPIELGLVGDAKEVLSLLTEKINNKSDHQFLKTCQDEAEKSVRSFQNASKATADGQFIHPQALTKMISDLAPENAIFCGDAGTVSVWFNNVMKLNGKQRYIWSGNLGSLGSGLTLAIGAKLAAPDRPVICLSGDGGFEMLIGDFATAVKYNLAILFIVYNNSEYGFIELEEQGEGNPAFGTKLRNPDFAALAKAYGGEGIKIKNYSDLENAIRTGLTANKPFIIDVQVNPKEMFIPPVITAKMAYEFARSQIRSFFAKLEN